MNDIGERNVDIIRNIRDALKVIRFHIGASALGRVLQRQKRGGDRRSGKGDRGEDRGG